MARKEKSGGGGDGGVPAWMVTFSDLMTLLLTFFVLLVSMAVMDQQRILKALGSISSTFSSMPGTFNPASPENQKSANAEGVMEGNDLAPIKDKLWEDTSMDVRFQENRFVQIISISGDVLFESGQSKLSEQGEALLNKMLPTLVNVEFPLLVAGHTASRRDEEGPAYAVSFDKKQVDSTWPLSLARSQSVYRYLLQNGMPEKRLTMEAFGQFRPRFADRSPSGRLQNRRVDIVLDKRNTGQIAALGTSKPKKTSRSPGQYLFRNFQFDLDAIPGVDGRHGRR